MHSGLNTFKLSKNDYDQTEKTYEFQSFLIILDSFQAASGQCACDAVTVLKIDDELALPSSQNEWM